MVSFFEYTQQAVMTESVTSTLHQEVLDRGLNDRVLHSIIGVDTELDEIVFNPDYDKVNLLEEFGDTMWYVAIFADAINFTGVVNSIINSDPSIFFNSAREATTAHVASVSLLVDHSKRVMFYGSKFDEDLCKSAFENIVMSIYYQTSIVYDTDIFTVLEANINKLKTRYPDKFDKSKAEHRNTDNERVQLEKDLSGNNGG